MTIRERIVWRRGRERSDRGRLRIPIYRQSFQYPPPWPLALPSLPVLPLQRICSLQRLSSLQRRCDEKIGRSRKDSRFHSVRETRDPPLDYRLRHSPSRPRSDRWNFPVSSPLIILHRRRKLPISWRRSSPHLSNPFLEPLSHSLLLPLSCRDVRNRLEPLCHPPPLPLSYREVRNRPPNRNSKYVAWRKWSRKLESTISWSPRRLKLIGNKSSSTARSPIGVERSSDGK